MFFIILVSTCIISLKCICLLPNFYSSQGSWNSLPTKLVYYVNVTFKWRLAYDSFYSYDFTFILGETDWKIIAIDVKDPLADELKGIFPVLHGQIN